MKTDKSLLIKITIIGVLTLLMLIPLGMIRSQISDRDRAAGDTAREVSKGWAGEQVVDGPKLKVVYDRTVTDDDGKSHKEQVTAYLYPKNLECDIPVATQKLHRSIYDVMVYTAMPHLTGAFIIPEKWKDIDAKYSLILGISDLRGVAKIGDASFCGSGFMFDDAVNGALEHALEPAILAKDGKTDLPFDISLTLKGSTSLSVTPCGSMTTVKMSGDCPDPSFCGSFLPTDRNVTESGFEASWSVSKFNRDRPEKADFGVRLLQDVTQYQKTTRSVKYAILIILLIFIAGLAVEWFGKTSIHPVQYLVIGLSLVLFYALLLSFSEFMGFGLAYALGAIMTTAALTAYFRGILKNRMGWMLGGLVLVAYAFSWMLLQMDTYALLCGTLMLFVLLCVIMYFTRDLSSSEKMQ